MKKGIKMSRRTAYRLVLSSVLVSACLEVQAAQSLASTLEVYVFPSEGQAAAQQSQDESECYQWAVNNSGVDPFESEKAAQAQTQQAEAAGQQAAQAGRGSGARGAIGGAAAGALIGEIADDDAGKGAAYGAAAGAIMSRRGAARQSRQAQQQAQQQAEQANTQSQARIENFRKAFSVCLEGKSYLVKY
jgi:hypothetical protein